MFRHRFHESVPRRLQFQWFLLAFLAGTVNTGGYMAAHRFVSHVTGFATLFGREAGLGNWDIALGFLSVPLFFLLGVMVSAYLVDRPAHRNSHPHYATVMALVLTCLLVVAIGGHLGWFGEFGKEPRLRQDYILLALLCTASGLQNAAISTASRATIRTTHLTGLTTDLGIGLVRALSSPKARERELRVSLFRSGIFLAFAFGSSVGAIAYLRYQYLGFLLPALVALYIALEASRPNLRLMKIKRLS